MAMPAIRRHWTRADLHRLPDDGNRYEVVKGELFVTPAPSPRHEELIRVLAEHLRELTKGSGVTVYAGNSAVVLSESQVLPDVQVRARVIPPPDTWEDAPTPLLVVEVVSPVTRRRDLVAKRTLYANAGIDYWLVDGDDRSITVFSGEGERRCSDSLDWRSFGASQPLTIDVASVFREALG